MHPESPAEPAPIIRARDLIRTETRGVRRHHLDVPQGEAARAQQPGGGHQGGVAGIGSTVEHGLAGEQPAEGHPEQSPHQAPLAPHLDAVRPPVLVQAHVGPHQPRGEPFAIAVAAAGVRDLGEGAVHAHLVPPTAQAPCHRARDAEPLDRHDPPRVGLVEADRQRRIADVHGKGALTVDAQQHRRVQLRLVGRPAAPAAVHGTQVSPAGVRVSSWVQPRSRCAAR